MEVVAPGHIVPTLDEHGRRILTVGQLREVIADAPDGAHVVIDDCDGWYRNVGSIGVPGDPDGDSPWACITLLAGTPIDTRQF